MKINSIVNRFILKELIPPFLITMGFFMFIFLMRQILEITDMIVNYQMSVGIFLLMIVYSMPYFLVYIIPMSVMMSVLLTFLRMSADNEILALRSAGISLYHMLAPVLTFAVAGFAVTLFMAAYGMPWGKSLYEDLSIKVVQSNFNIGLKEHQFIDGFDGVVMYVNSVDAGSSRMKGVFIKDARKSGPERTVVAPEGYLFKGKDPHSFVIRLYNGLVSQSDPGAGSAHSTRFDTYDIRLDLQSAVSAAGSERKDEKEMGMAELCAYLKNNENRDKRYYSMRMELHRKFSIPFACIALALLGMPLGVQSFSARKSAGLSIGLICFLFYYLLLSGAMVLGETGRYHPAPLLWLPNLIMGGAGLYLLVKAANDSQVVLFGWLSKAWSWMLRLMQKRKDADAAGDSESSGDLGRS